MDFSQQIMGAVAIGDIFVNYAYFAKKERLSQKEIENDFQNFVHIMSNPYRLSNQSLRFNEQLIIDNRKVEIGEFVNSYDLDKNGNCDISTENLFIDSLNLETGATECKKIKGVLKHKRRNPIYKLKLKTGQEIEVTEDHSIFSVGDDGTIKETSPIKAKNVIIPFGKHDFNEESEIMLSPEMIKLGRKNISKIPINKDTMFLFGLYLGDGNIHGSRMTISTFDTDLDEYVKKIVEENFGFMCKKQLKKEQSGNALAINSGKSFNAFMLENFGHGSHGKFINKRFQNHKLAKYLLAGYIQADGCISKNKWDISISSINEMLLYDCMKILLNNKILPKISKHIRKHPYKKDRLHTIYKLAIHKHDAVKFKDLLYYSKRHVDSLCDTKFGVAAKKMYSLHFVTKLLNGTFKGLRPQKVKDLNIKFTRSEGTSPDYERFLLIYEALKNIKYDTPSNYKEAATLAKELGMTKVLSNEFLSHYEWASGTWDLTRKEPYGLDRFIEHSKIYYNMIQNLIKKLSILENAIPIEVESCEEISNYDEEDEYVYDISVEDNENFITAKNIFAHNSPFTNVSIFDRNNLKALFGDYRYPDGSEIDIDYIMEIQEIFARWFAKGDPCTGLPYRFPVVTAAFLNDEESGYPLDEEFLDMVSKINLKTGFLNIYISNSAGKIASCCRLSNDFNELAGSDSFGNGGLNIGSARVITLNLPRIAYKNMGNFDNFYKALDTKLNEIKDILNIHRVILHKRANKNFLKFIEPLRWMNIDKMLFSTIGVIGIYECLEIMGIDIREKKGIEEAQRILSIIRDKARDFTKKYKVGFNVEQIPGESVAVKFAEKDKIMFGEDVVKYTMYSNQFIPLWEDFDLYDRVKLDGHFSKILTGGGITHLNVSEKLRHPAQMRKLIRFAMESGCEHFAINYGFGECEEGHVNVVGNRKDCPECGKDIKNYYTRVIGYFVPVSSWHKVRREYEFPRRKFGKIVKV